MKHQPVGNPDCHSNQRKRSNACGSRCAICQRLRCSSSRARYGSLFQQVVACMISVRTYEEVSLPASIRLFDRPRPLLAIAALDGGWIELISPIDIPRAQGGADFGDRPDHPVETSRASCPVDEETVLGFPGIGPKCAALALGIACGQERLPVDIHVHRVANRGGCAHQNTRTNSGGAAGRVSRPKHWLELNERLVPFGKSICTRLRPGARHVCCWTCVSRLASATRSR